MSGEVITPRAEEHLGLVHLCANRFRNRGIDYDELYSAGCVGLLKAVKAFDCTRGVQFSTYAVPVILGEIKRLFRDGGIVHISRSLRERATRLQKLQEIFEQQHGRSPTVSELSALSGDSVEECGEARAVRHSGGSSRPANWRSAVPAAADGGIAGKRPHAVGTAVFSGTDTEQNGGDPGNDTGAGVAAGEKTADAAAAGVVVIELL